MPSQERVSAVLDRQLTAPHSSGYQHAYCESTPLTSPLRAGKRPVKLVTPSIPWAHTRFWISAPSVWMHNGASPYDTEVPPPGHASIYLPFPDPISFLADMYLWCSWQRESDGALKWSRTTIQSNGINNSS